MMANSPLSVDPDLAFVARACDPDQPDPGAAGVRSWARVLDLAIAHRVYPRVAQFAITHFPPAEATALRTRTQQNARAALRLLARTAEVVDLLHGIDSFVLKGPLLADDLYGDVALRTAGDVDILVREDDLLRACQILDRAGYAHHTPVTARAIARHRRSSHDVAFAHPEDQTLIELHVAIAQPHYGFAFDLARWWAKRRARRVGNTELSTLSPEHGFLMAAAHAAKHRWERLDLLCDLVVYRRKALNWPEVYSEAAEAWMLKPVRAGERIAAACFGDGGRLNDVERGVVQKLVAGQQFGRRDGARLDLALRERTADRIRYLWRRALTSMPKL